MEGHTSAKTTGSLSLAPEQFMRTLRASLLSRESRVRNSQNRGALPQVWFAMCPLKPTWRPNAAFTTPGLLQPSQPLPFPALLLQATTRAAPRKATPPRRHSHSRLCTLHSALSRVIKNRAISNHQASKHACTRTRPGVCMHDGRGGSQSRVTTQLEVAQPTNQRQDSIAAKPEPRASRQVSLEKKREALCSPATLKAGHTSVRLKHSL